MARKLQWEKLGELAPTELVDARLQLHWAAQIPAAVGNTLVRPASDFSHTALSWDGRAGALVTDLLAGDTFMYAGLRTSDLTLLILDGIGAELAAISLVDRTLTWGMAWMSENLKGLSSQEFETLAAPEHDLPDAPAGSGAAFTLQASPWQELGRWFANADAVLQTVRREVDLATPVRCWPHHFDIATVIDLGRAKGGGQERSVGIGMSPGDASYAEPYLYVQPTPAPEPADLPALEPAGKWHTEGWTAAVLTAAELIEAEDQPALAQKFVRTTVRACYGFLLDE